MILSLLYGTQNVTTKTAKMLIAEHEGIKNGPSYLKHKGLIGTNSSKAPFLNYKRHQLFVVVPSGNIASLN